MVKVGLNDAEDLFCVSYVGQAHFAICRKHLQSVTICNGFVPLFLKRFLRTSQYAFFQLLGLSKTIIPFSVTVFVPKLFSNILSANVVGIHLSLPLGSK